MLPAGDKMVHSLGPMLAEMQHWSGQGPLTALHFVSSPGEKSLAGGGPLPGGCSLKWPR